MKPTRRQFLHPAAGAAAPIPTLPAVPDGYTILFASSTFAINPSLDAMVRYADAVHRSGPARSVKELVDLIKARQVLRRANVMKQASIKGRSLGHQAVRREDSWPESVHDVCGTA
jgi:hypothetical protein